MKKTFFKTFIFSLLLACAANINTSVLAKTCSFGKFQIQADDMVSLNDSDGVEIRVAANDIDAGNYHVTMVDHNNLVAQDWTMSEGSVDNLPQWNWQRFNVTDPGADRNVQAYTRLVPTQIGDYNIWVEFDLNGVKQDCNLPVKVVEADYDLPMPPRNHFQVTFDKLAENDPNRDQAVLFVNGLSIQPNKVVTIVLVYDPKLSYDGVYDAGLGNSSAYQLQHLAGAKYQKYTFHGGANADGEVMISPLFSMPQGYENYQVRIAAYVGDELVYSLN